MQVRFYAVGREIAGTTECSIEAASMLELREQLEAKFGLRMHQLLEASTLLVQGQRFSIQDEHTFAGEDVLDVLPPFAGG